MNIPLFSTCWMMMIKSWRILDTVSFACITSYFVKQLSTHKQRAQTTRTNNAHPPRYIQVIYCYINYFLKVNKLIALLTLLLVYPAYKHSKKKHKLTILSVYCIYIYISVFHQYFHRITGITWYHSVSPVPASPWAQLRSARSWARRPSQQTCSVASGCRDVSDVSVSSAGSWAPAPGPVATPNAERFRCTFWSFWTWKIRLEKPWKTLRCINCINMIQHVWSISRVLSLKMMQK